MSNEDTTPRPAQVVELSSRNPHITGHAVCCCCGHDWVAVYPLSAKQLECPKCNDFTQIKVFMGEITGIARFSGRSSDDEFERALRAGTSIGKALSKAAADDAAGVLDGEVKLKVVK